MFTIIPGPGAKKFLKNLNKKIRERILNKIRELSENPRPIGSIKVVGEKDTYRIRIGDYRVLYEIYYDREIILVAKIDRRDRIYD